MKSIRLFFAMLFALLISFGTTTDCRKADSCLLAGRIEKIKEKKAKKKKPKKTRTSSKPRKIRKRKKRKCKKSCPDKTCSSCKDKNPHTKKRGIFSAKKSISKLDYEELKIAKNQLVAEGNKEVVIKYIEKMVPLCTDLGELSSLMLELADIFFDLDYIAKAERLYKEFFELYPGDKKAEYAIYRAIVCSYTKTREYYRDQSKTQDTVELAKKFLDRKNVFTTYTKEVENILLSCYEKLLESEINIFNFYLTYENYIAAETRLKNIEKEFVPLLPSKEPLLLSLGCDLAEKQKNPELLAQRQAELEVRFPEYNKEKLLLASNKKQKRFVEKF